MAKTRVIFRFAPRIAATNHTKTQSILLCVQKANTQFIHKI